jgi:hypothetical protein
MAALVVAAAAPAADKVDNPAYKSWAQYKPGTVVVTKTTSEVGGMKSEVSMTSTLAEVTADKVVVEVITATKVNGMEFKGPAVKQDIPRQYDAPKGGAADPKGAKPEGKTEDGTKKMKVGGTEFDCKWVKYSGTGADSETTTSDAMPGMMVKSVTKAGAVTSTTEVVEVTLKK